jgi:phage terminase small subunit
MNQRQLTIKQQKFCDAYVLCGNASEAYRQCYTAGKMSQASIKVNASKLLKNTNIALTLKGLREESKKEFCVSAEQKRRILWNLVNSCAEVDFKSKKIINPAAVISAIAEMNKMDGDLATIKNEHSGDLTVTNLVAEISKRNAENRAVLPKMVKK